MDITKSSLLTYFTRLSVFVIQIFSGLLLARVLGPQGRGEYALLVIIPTMAGVFCNLGIGNSNVYYVGSGKLELEKVISNSITLALLLGGATIVVLNLFAGDIAIRFLRGVRTDYFRIASISIPFLLMYLFLISVVHGLKRFVEYNQATVFKPSVLLVAMVLFFVLLDSKLLGAILAWNLSVFLSSLVLINSLRRLTASRFSLHIDFQALKQTISFGYKSYIAEAATFLNYRFGILLIGYFLSPVEVGYFAIAIVIAESLWFLASSMGVVLFPTTASLSEESASRMIPKAVRTIFLITTIMVFVLLFTDTTVVRLAFGDDFLPAVSALRFLYPGIAAFSIIKVISGYILGRGKPAVTMNISLVGLFANLLLNVALIPRLGIDGAAIAASSSYVLMTIIEVLWFVKTTRIKATKMILIERSDLRSYLGVVRKLRRNLLGFTAAK